MRDAGRDERAGARRRRSRAARRCWSTRATSAAIAAGIEEAPSGGTSCASRGLERAPRRFTGSAWRRDDALRSTRGGRVSDAARRRRRGRARPPADRRRDLRREPAARAARGRRPASSASPRSRGTRSSSGRRRAARAAGALQELRMALVAAAAAAPAAAGARALPARAAAACPCPAVVTIHDLSFERDPAVMGRARPARLPARRARARRGGARVLAVSERTKRDLVELYGFRRSRSSSRRTASTRRSARGRRRRRLPALRRRDTGAEEPARGRSRRPQAVGLPLVVVGPEKEPASRGSSSATARTCAATSRRTSSPSSIAAPPRLVLPSRYEGSGCRCSRRWPRDAGRRHRRPAMREVARRRGRLRRAASWRGVARRSPSATARRRGARAGTALHWEETARGHSRLPRGARRERLRDRRLPRAPRRSWPFRCPRSRRRSTSSS